MTAPRPDDMRPEELRPGDTRPEDRLPTDLRPEDLPPEDRHVERLRCLRDDNRHAERELEDRIAALGRTAGLEAPFRATPPADGMLSRTLRRLARACSLPLRDATLRALEQRTDAAARDVLTEAARKEGWRMRPVDLDADIHARTSQPLLAFRAETGEPAVLFPHSNGGRLYDPARDETRPLTARECAGLERRAFCFYETFPAGPLNTRTLAAFIFRQARPILLLLGVTGTLSALLGMLGPLVTEYVTGRIIPAARYDELLQLGALLVVLAACGAGFQLVPALSLVVFSSRQYERFQAAVFDRCLRIPVNAFRQCPAGDMSQRILGAARIQGAVFSIVTSQFLGAVFNVFSLIMMFHYSPGLALAGTGLVFVYAGGLFLLARRNLGPLAEHAAAEGRLSGLLRQFLEGMSKIRTAVAETRVISRCMVDFAVQAEEQYRISRNGAVQALYSSAFPMLICLLFYALIGGAWRKEMELPAFLAFMAAFQNFQSGIAGLAGGLWSLLAIRPDWERILPILRTPPENSNGGEDPGRLDGRVELAHVSFRYHADQPRTLDDICLKAGPGEFVAVAGPSGAGKSTLVRLLLGFEQPESGSVLYSGRDLAGMDVRLLRRQLGVILQNSRIITASILENIVIGTEYGPDEAWKALEMAAMADTVRAMPMGIHTVVSPETISGGQQQRILLARALVGEPALLLLDESTSALDNAAQEIVRKHLDSLRATRIVIAHRLSTIINADRIYVLEKGRVVQTGSYAELIAREGLFRRLVERQWADGPECAS